MVENGGFYYNAHIRVDLLILAFRDNLLRNVDLTAQILKHVLTKNHGQNGIN